jgi:NAD(P)-dependent dehydrogenase (short-subunit alcohol dehydrogenase family)
MSIKQQADTRTVVVTGTSSGIGEACALQLDGLGFRVFAGIRKEADGVALQQKASARLTPVLLDITDAASIASAVDTLTSTFGVTRLAGLVNNAGIAVAGPLEFLPIADLRKQLEVNVIGHIAVTQAFLPLLRQGRGRVVMVGSLGGRVALPFNGPYHASKFALEGLTDSLRVELRPWGIQVALVEAGIISTPLWKKSTIGEQSSLAHLPQHTYDLYGPAVPALSDFALRATKIGTPSDAVARAIVHALTASRPKTRYLVGRGTWLGTTIFARLPDRLRDFLIAQVLPKYP